MPDPITERRESILDAIDELRIIHTADQAADPVRPPAVNFFKALDAACIELGDAVSAGNVPLELRPVFAAACAVVRERQIFDAACQRIERACIQLPSRPLSQGMLKSLETLFKAVDVIDVPPAEPKPPETFEQLRRQGLTARQIAAVMDLPLAAVERELVEPGKGIPADWEHPSTRDRREREAEQRREWKILPTEAAFARARQVEREEKEADERRERTSPRQYGGGYSLDQAWVERNNAIEAAAKGI